MSAEFAAAAYGVGFFALFGRRRYFLGLSRFVLLAPGGSRVHERNNCVCVLHFQVALGGLLEMRWSVRDRWVASLGFRLGVGVDVFRL